VKKIIKRAHEKWVANEDNQQEELIWIRDDMLEQLEQTAFESSKFYLNVRMKEWKSHSFAETEIKTWV
jgi:hypothetical protein